MLGSILKFSIERSKLILVFVLAIAALGAWNFTKLPIDAVPDITNVQVVINTEGCGLYAVRSGTKSYFSIGNCTGRSA